MLNVDTPETKDPDADVECLGPQAAARLGELIPVGSTVTLTYDEDRIDTHGRTLAGVHDGAGRLVNAELAREGLGTAVLIEPNDRFYDDVLDAQDEARVAARGLYSPAVACTVPARVEKATSAVASAQHELRFPSPDPAGLDRAAQRTLVLIDEIGAVQSAFTGPRRGLVWAALSPDDDRRLAGSVGTAHADARALHARWTALADETRKRLAAEQERIAREQAEKAAADRAAREAEQRRRAEREEEDRRRADRAAEESRLAAAPPAVTAPAGSEPAPAAAAPAPARGGCDAGYTPCVPVSAKDLDCGDLPGGPYQVIGSDRHRLDADDDGVGCEGNG
nr:thermonuclease family protein [Pseudonocardia sp. C8]